MVGINLDVGEFPNFAGTGTDADDPEALARIVAHMVARIGDKFTFLRRFSRNAEGQEKRAGLLSDLVSALYALWKRNPDAAEQIARGLVSDVKAKQAARASANGKPASAPQQTGVTV